MRLLGLLDPAECVERAERAWREGLAPLSSVEGFVRQIAGWREYVWQVYWYFGEDHRRPNALRHTAPLPDWWSGLDADAVRANCLRTVLAQVRDTGWTHHIPRLMVLGSHALQRGWDPPPSRTGSTAASRTATPGSCSPTSSASPRTPTAAG